MSAIYNKMEQQELKKQIEDFEIQFQKLHTKWDLYDTEYKNSENEFERKLLNELKEKISEEMKEVLKRKIEMKMTITTKKEEPIEEMPVYEDFEIKYPWVIMCHSKCAIYAPDFNYSRDFKWKFTMYGIYDNSKPYPYVYKCRFQNEADYKTAEDITLYNMSYKNRSNYSWSYEPYIKEVEEVIEVKKVIEQQYKYINITTNEEIPIESIIKWYDNRESPYWYANKAIMVQGRKVELHPIWKSSNPMDLMRIPKFYICNYFTSFQTVSLSTLQEGDIVSCGASSPFEIVFKITEKQVHFKKLVKKDIGFSGDYHSFYYNWFKSENEIDTVRAIRRENKIGSFRKVVSDNTIRKFTGDTNEMVYSQGGDGGR